MRHAVGRLDPACTRADDAARLLEVFCEIERLAAAGRTLLTKRAAESKIWQREGHRTAAAWISAKTDMPLGLAIASVETAARLQELPDTQQAFREGQLSEARAREVASAAAEAPDRERELLAFAQTRSIGELREECRRVRAAAAPDELARYEAIRRSRYFRSWSEADGAVRLDARLTPDAGAAVLATIDARKNEIFKEARRAGRREPYQAYAADALVSLATGDTRGAAPGPRAMVHVRVDHAALMRGHAEAGEVCEIPGIGPIPVATARALASDAILKVLVTDGVDIKAVAHAGRTISAHLRTALEARDQTCVVPDCDIQHGLQIDHRIPLSSGGLTTLENLDRMCPWHHYLKTHCGYRIEGGPGSWQLRSPDQQEGTRGEARPPPAA